MSNSIFRNYIHFSIFISARYGEFLEKRIKKMHMQFHYQTITF